MLESRRARSFQKNRQQLRYLKSSCPSQCAAKSISIHRASCEVIFDAAVGTTHPLLNLVVPWHLEHLELKPIITRGFKQSAAKLFPQLRPAPSTQDHSRSLKHSGSWNRMESLHSESSMPRQQRQCFHESHFP